MILRREFLGVCIALGISATADANDGTFEGSVAIVGAGVAGMSVGHLLKQRGVEFSIVEAAEELGGRVKTQDEFVDFPLPLGGEWLHVDEGILSKIVNDDSVAHDVEIAAYLPQCTYGYFARGKLRRGRVGTNKEFLRDKKFVGGTWLTFFRKFIVPDIEDRMRFQSQVVSVDHSRDRIALKCADGSVITADAVVLTVPPQIIKEGVIRFHPPLPKQKRDAFDDAYIWGGMKVFLEFSESFYPTFLEIAGTNNRKGQKLFYDAAYGQSSASNVLGLFVVGDQAKPYQKRVGDDLRDYVLGELDVIFEGAASRSYIKHLAQNWNEEEFVRQAYLADSADWRLPPRMRESIDNRLFFAGDTYTDGEDWGSVHTAVLSARDAVDELLR